MFLADHAAGQAILGSTEDGLALGRGIEVSQKPRPNEPHIVDKYSSPKSLDKWYSSLRRYMASLLLTRVLDFGGLGW